MFDDMCNFELINGKEKVIDSCAVDGSSFTIVHITKLWQNVWL